MVSRNGQTLNYTYLPVVTVTEFLVGVFEEKARLLVAIFFVSSTRSVHFLCIILF